jgi:transcription termination/antitermination protein NusG
MSMMKDNPFEWFAVRVIAGQEKKVKQYFESEIKRLSLENYIGQIAVPMEKVFEVRNGKKVSREKTLFSGYMFVQLYVTYGKPEPIETTAKAKREAEAAADIALIQPEMLQIIKDTPGVVGFVGRDKGKTPMPLRSDEVQVILQKMEDLKNSEETPEAPYVSGESVKVLDGPFKDFTGIVEEIFEDKKKLKVMVKIFGRNVPLELNYLQVERAS